MIVADAAIRAALAACERSLAAHAANVRHLRALVEDEAGVPDLRHDGADIDASHRRAATIDVEAKPVAQPQNPGWRRYEFQGQRLTCQQLADLAGCGYVTMHARLRKFDAGKAVGMGAANPVRRDLVPKPPAEKREPKRHQVGDELLTVTEMAQRAGATVEGMRQRLLRGMTPAEAVAAGARKARSDIGGTKAARPPSPPAPLAVPTPAPTPTPVLAAPKPTPFNPDMTAARKAPDLARDAEVIVPENVKRTVAPTPPDRFAPDPGHVGVFSQLGPGRYVR